MDYGIFMLMTARFAANIAYHAMAYTVMGVPNPFKL